MWCILPEIYNVIDHLFSIPIWCYLTNFFLKFIFLYSFNLFFCYSSDYVQLSTIFTCRDVHCDQSFFFKINSLQFIAFDCICIHIGCMFFTYHLFLHAGSAIAHFRFKEEQSWEEDKVGLQGDANQPLLSIDCNQLVSALQCLPLYAQLRLDTDIFTVRTLILFVVCCTIFLVLLLICFCIYSYILN